MHCETEQRPRHIRKILETVLSKYALSEDSVVRTVMQYGSASLTHPQSHKQVEFRSHAFEELATSRTLPKACHSDKQRIAKCGRRSGDRFY